MDRRLARWQFVCVGVWLALCGLGTGALWRYSGRPGRAGVPAPVWPLAAEAPLDRAGPTVVLFAHPRCPCTSATLAQLERLQGRVGREFPLRVLFFEPEGGDASWRETGLWRRARAMPGVQVSQDPGGRMARACGAMTSGVVGVYGADGSLLYWGGVTPSRGHEGESAGLDAVAAVLTGSSDAGGGAAVYGCDLLGSCGPGVAEVRP